MQKSIGSIVVTEKGSIVLLTETDVIGETNGLPIGVYDAGIVLRGTAPVGSRCSIPNTAGLRVVSHVGELIRFLAQARIDLDTPAVIAK